jgi:hypothetical protein
MDNHEIYVVCSDAFQEKPITGDSISQLDLVIETNFE